MSTPSKTLRSSSKAPPRRVSCTWTANSHPVSLTICTGESTPPATQKPRQELPAALPRAHQPLTIKRTITRTMTRKTTLRPTTRLMTVRRIPPPPMTRPSQNLLSSLILQLAKPMTRFSRDHHQRLLTHSSPTSTSYSTVIQEQPSVTSSTT